MEGVCAFVRLDGMCVAPLACWPKQFRKLLSRVEPGEGHNDVT
jgi:hypothetical protein